jgi:hypothetical protein
MTYRPCSYRLVIRKDSGNVARNFEVIVPHYKESAADFYSAPPARNCC